MKELRFWLPVLIFLGAVVLCAWLVRPARGDDFAANLAKLKAQNAAPDQDKHDVAGDPFAPKKPPPCGCANCPGLSPGGTYKCEGGCTDGTCAARTAGPRVGDQKVTDDPNRPWTYSYGREYGWNELGWYRPAVPAYRPTYYYQPQGRVYYQTAGCAGGS